MVMPISLLIKENKVVIFFYNFIYIFNCLSIKAMRKSENSVILCSAEINHLTVISGLFPVIPVIPEILE